MSIILNQSLQICAVDPVQYLQICGLHGHQERHSFTALLDVSEMLLQPVREALNAQQRVLSEVSHAKQTASQFDLQETFVPVVNRFGLFIE